MSPSPKSPTVFSSASAPAPQPAAAGACPPALTNVLIVDHEARTREQLGAWFGDRGFFVTPVEHHETAAAMLRTVRFDVIVCEAAAASHRARRWIEQMLLAPPCPAIFLAEHPTLETAVRIANLPRAAYLAKPVDFVALERLVARFQPHPSPPSAPATGLNLIA